MKKHIVIAATLSLFSSISMAAVPKKLNAFVEGERFLYTRLIEAYRKNNLAETVKQKNALEKNYPASIHLDNAYYLIGKLQFQNDQLGEAVRSFNTVTDRFPKSNKRPAALFALASTYQKLNLEALARKVYQNIMKQYPGSPESQRAWMHLELAKKDSRTLKK